MEDLKRKIKILEIETKLANEKEKLKDILPEHLQNKFDIYAFIGGGCIYSLYNNQEPKDYDFFLTDEDFMKELRSYFEGEVLPNYLEDLNQKIRRGTYKGYDILVTDNAISIGEKYQIVTKWVGYVEDVVSQFDFKHNQFYYQYGQINTLSDYKYLESNKLKYNEQRARDICGTIMRVPKFVERGMEISKYEMSKMLLKLSEVGFDNREMEILHTTHDFDS